MIYLMIASLIIVMLATALLIASLALGLILLPPIAATIGIVAMVSFTVTFLIEG